MSISSSTRRRRASRSPTRASSTSPSSARRPIGAATIHCGDIYHIDVAGARAAGLPAVLLDAAGLYGDADCPRVASLPEFADRLLAGAFD